MIDAGYLVQQALKPRGGPKAAELTYLAVFHVFPSRFPHGVRWILFLPPEETVLWSDGRLRATFHTPVEESTTNRSLDRQLLVIVVGLCAIGPCISHSEHTRSSTCKIASYAIVLQ